MSDEQKKEKLKQIEDFFILNIKVKRIILEIMPTYLHDHNNESRIEYENRISTALRQIENIFLGFSKNFCNELITEKIKKMFDIYQTKLMECNQQFNKMQNFYRACIADLDEGLVSIVRDNFVGYYLNRNFSSVIDNCVSVHDILHTFHAYITNNEDYYEVMPKIDEKINEENYPITLYGKETELATEIFNSFPLDMDCGWTSILSLEKTNKIIMMIRDRGHALSIEIDIEGEDVWINYFIPKICNVEMVNSLEGVTKVNEDSRTTIGVIQASRENLTQKLFTLISHVPMDIHMNHHI